MSGRWTNAMLDAKRRIGDPPADELVERLCASGDIPEIRELMHVFLENDDLPLVDVEPIQEFLRSTAALPRWARPDLIAAGQDLFRRWGPSICMSLFFASLPSAYAGANGVKVLSLTARLETDPQRRILETAQFLLDVMEPDSLVDHDGRGIASAQKIRLIHAVVRHLIQDRARCNPAIWDGRWGTPLNQEDLAGTLMTFSWLVIQVLDKVGVEVTSYDAEAYLHTWNVIGYLMGIQEDLLPATMRDAGALMATIQARQVAPSAEGRAMTAALVRLMKDMIPGEHHDSLPPAMIRYLITDRIADMLGVERLALGERIYTRLVILFTRIYLGRRSRNKRLARIAEPLGQRLLESSPLVPRHAGRSPFSVPNRLQIEWRLRAPHPDVARRFAGSTGGDA